MDGGGGGLRAIGDPLPDEGNRTRRQTGLRRRAAEGHLRTDGLVTFELLNDVAVVGISGLHPEKGGPFGARYAHQQIEAVGRIQAQTLRRAAADMTDRAYRRENIS